MGQGKHGRPAADRHGGRRSRRAGLSSETGRPCAGSGFADRRYPVGSELHRCRDAIGLNARTIYGGERHNKYLLETTGCGVAFYDYDQDGWLDLFLVNGWRLEGFAPGQEPTCHLFKNNRDGTFTDVTRKAGLARSGWGQACCVGDYDNDGHDDLFISYYGQNALFHNNGDGTFTDATVKAGLRQSRRDGTPAAPSSTTTVIAILTSSSATTSTWI